MTDTLKATLRLLPTARALIALSEAESERDAALLELKALVEKYGARNSRMDQGTIQAAHDLMVKLGAMCGDLESKGALVWRHPGHPNQKVHGNRYGGYSATKESLRRLKDDKAARERYKQSARKRQGGGGVANKPRDRLTGEPQVGKVREIRSKAGATRGQILRKEFEVTRIHAPSGLKAPVVNGVWSSVTNKWRVTDMRDKEIGTTDSLSKAKKIAVEAAKKINEQ